MQAVVNCPQCDRSLVVLLNGKETDCACGQFTILLEANYVQRGTPREPRSQPA